MLTTGLVWDERYAWHNANPTSDHPWAEPWPALDQLESKRRMYSLLEASGVAAKTVRIPARQARDDELHRFHTAEYVQRIRAASEAGGGEAGEAARFGPHGFTVASLAAGRCIEALSAATSGYHFRRSD